MIHKVFLKRTAIVSLVLVVVSLVVCGLGVAIGVLSGAVVAVFSALALHFVRYDSAVCACSKLRYALAYSLKLILLALLVWVSMSVLGMRPAHFMLGIAVLPISALSMLVGVRARGGNGDVRI